MAGALLLVLLSCIKSSGAGLSTIVLFLQSRLIALILKDDLCIGRSFLHNSFWALLRLAFCNCSSDSGRVVKRSSDASCRTLSIVSTNIDGTKFLCLPLY